MPKDALTLDDTLRIWIAECLMRHVPSEHIVGLLQHRGLTADEANAALAAAQTNPAVEAGRRIAKETKRLEWLLRVYEYSYTQSAHAGTIERRANLSPEAFLECYYSVNRPVILTDLMQDWKALKAWTPEYLKQQFGDILVTYLRSLADEAGTCRYVNETMPFGPYVDMMMSAGETNAFYLTAYNTHQHQQLVNRMLADVEMFPGFLDPAKAADKVHVWIGPAGTVGQLHIDAHNVFLAQVMGTKRVRLIPSHHLPHLYLDNDFFSPVNPEVPDFERYPMAQYATVCETVLSPGEVLFLPVAWWHQVRALSPSISMSFVNFVFNNLYYPISAVYQELGVPRDTRLPDFDGATDTQRYTGQDPA